MFQDLQIYILKSLPITDDSDDRDIPEDVELDRCCFTLFDDNIDQPNKKQLPEHSSRKTVHCIGICIFYKHGSLILLKSEVWYLYIQSPIFFLVLNAGHSWSQDAKKVT